MCSPATTPCTSSATARWRGCSRSTRRPGPSGATGGTGASSRCSRTERVRGSRRLALVVDDEAPLAALVRSYLEREGFEVATAGEGETAVELARERAPDVIVLDLMLPGIDGIEACRRMRSFSDAYILMLTARAEEVDKIVGLSTGADDYLTKPFSPGELVARVRALLRRPRQGATPATVPRRFGERAHPAARRRPPEGVAGGGAAARSSHRAAGAGRD